MNVDLLIQIVERLVEAAEQHLKEMDNYKEYCREFISEKDYGEIIKENDPEKYEKLLELMGKYDDIEDKLNIF